MMAKALTRRERRKICKDYYRAARKGWMDKLKASIRRGSGSNEEDSEG